MKEKKVIVLLLMIFTAVIFISFNPSFTGSAISEEDSSDEIVIENALAGEEIKTQFFLTLQSKDLVNLEVLPSGEIKDWITLEEDYVMLPYQKNAISLSISVPEGTPEGNYKTKLILMYVEDLEEKSILEDQVLEYIHITVKVTGIEKEGIELKEFEVYDIETDSEIDYSLVIKNEGNKETKKTVIIDVFDEEKERVSKTEFVSNIKAYETKNILQEIPTELEEGKYTAYAQVDEFVMISEFNIYQQGQIKKNGEILNSQVSLSEEGLFQTKSHFKNTGSSVLYTTMKGDITSEEELAHTFKTKEEKIYPNEIFFFEYEFGPLDGGEYEIDLEFTSENTVLDEKEATFYSTNVISLEANFVIIFALILFLLVVSHYLLSRKENE
jgi:hypothetical protein